METLASELEGAFEVALDDTHVYATLFTLETDGVVRVPKGGGVVEEIMSTR